MTQQSVENVVIEFPSGVSDINYTMNKRVPAKEIYFKWYSARGNTIVSPTIWVLIDEVSMNQVCENRAGYTLPYLKHAQGPGIHGAGLAVETPWLMATSNRSSLQSFRIRLQDSLGAPLVHTGFGLGLIVVGEHKFESIETRKSTAYIKRQNVMATYGNDTRHDFAPTLNQQDPGLPVSGFSMKGLK